MEKMIVLLRGINVGGNRKVPMAALRNAARAAGLDDIETYIQSGNLLFTAKSPADAEARIEALIEAEFGFPVEAIARSAASWADYAAGSPFPEAEADRPNLIHLGLSKQAPKDGIAETLHARAKHGERVVVAGDAIWIDYGGGVADSKLSPVVIDRAVGSTVTMRNWRTVLKLAEMAAD
ncbi:MAG: hypothetical protein JWR77_2436 [Rhizorhabdus sp.]|nr:hypothetical protein [Rhizorhabdus sp.]